MSEFTKKELKQRSPEDLYLLAIEEIVEGQEAGSRHSIRDAAPLEATHYGKAAALANLACYKAIVEGQND